MNNYVEDGIKKFGERITWSDSFKRSTSMCKNSWKKRAIIAEPGILYAESASNLKDTSEVFEEPETEHRSTYKLYVNKRRAASLQLYRKRSNYKSSEFLLAERGENKSWKPRRAIAAMSKVGTVLATRYEFERHCQEYSAWCTTDKGINIHQTLIKATMTCREKQANGKMIVSRQPKHATCKFSLFSFHVNSCLGKPECNNGSNTARRTSPAYTAEQISPLLLGEFADINGCPY